jgi:hypothetical protein
MTEIIALHLGDLRISQAVWIFKDLIFQTFVQLLLSAILLNLSSDWHCNLARVSFYSWLPSHLDDARKKAWKGKGNIVMVGKKSNKVRCDISHNLLIFRIKILQENKLQKNYLRRAGKMCKKGNIWMPQLLMSLKKKKVR